MAISPLINKSAMTQYHVGSRSRVLREALVGWQMFRKTGLWATIAHVRTIALVRLGRLLVDRTIEDQLPRPLRGELPLKAELCAVTEQEAASAVAHSPISGLTFRWALKGLKINPSDYHFVDIGSGRGGAVLRAAMLAFRTVTGIEFVRPYHEDAVENVNWARDSGLIKAGTVELQHKSALETELPNGPCIIFLYAPFEESIMRPFLDLIDRQLRDRPRPVIAIYVNPVVRRAFERPGVAEISIARLERTLISLFGPHEVRAYSWRSSAPGVEQSEGRV